MNTHPMIALTLCALLLLASCRQADDFVLPTLAQLPSATTTPSITPSPSSTPSATLTLTPKYTLTSSLTPGDPPTATPTPSATTTPTDTLTPTPTLTLTPPPSSTPLPSSFVFGESVEGRELRAFRLGTGAQTILLVGGIHTGYERNTVTLVEELLAHFQATPADIDAGITLLFVPLLNADGLRFGQALRGRFNSRGVDLNRNWACEWSERAVFQEQPVYPGDEPFSEPESTALGSLIQRARPAAVLFYHAAADGVFPGNCTDSTSGLSDDLAAVYGQAANYPYEEHFSAYPITGGAAAWVDSIGIPAVDVELSTADGIEFERNLAGVLAVQRWLLERGE